MDRVAASSQTGMVVLKFRVAVYLSNIILGSLESHHEAWERLAKWDSVFAQFFFGPQLELEA